MSQRFRRRYLLVIPLALIALLLVAQNWLFPYALRWLDVGETPQRADAVFVLLGNPDTRPFVAAAIYNAGLVSEVLLARHQPITENKYLPPEHVAYRKVLLHQGVPDADIHLLGQGIIDTNTEVQTLGVYLDQHPQVNVIVVTTHFHTRRTRWSLRRNLGPRADRLQYVSAPHDDFDPSNWWLLPRGFEFVLLEYVKLFAYWVFYGNARWYALTLVVVTTLTTFVRHWKTTQHSTPESNS